MDKKIYLYFFLALVIGIGSATLMLRPMIVKKDMFRQMLEYAEMGDREAQYYVGTMYADGVGVPQDAAKAFEWYKKSADQSYPLALYKVGYYYGGKNAGGVPFDGEKSIDYKTQAAQAGYAVAQADIGTFFFANERNIPKAFPWMKAAAEQGDARAMLNVSILYGDGRAGVTDMVRSYAYFKISRILMQESLDEADKKNIEEMKSKMSEAEVKQAEDMVANWKAQPSDITLKAQDNFESAKQYLKRKKG